MLCERDVKSSLATWFLKIFRTAASFGFKIYFLKQESLQCLIKMKDWSRLCQCGNFTHLTLRWNFSVASPSFDWLDNFLFSPWKRPRILLHCLKIQSKYSFVESKNKANKNPISSRQDNKNSHKSSSASGCMCITSLEHYLFREWPVFWRLSAVKLIIDIFGPLKTAWIKWERNQANDF